MIKLSDHFTYRKLLKYTFPTVIMLIVTSVYVVADGFFVSNFAGKTPFTAVNFIWPYLMILGSFGFMFGTGGGALIAKTIGEGKRKKANEIFSMIIYVSLAVGVVLAVGGILSVRAVAAFFGAEGELLEESVIYGKLYLIGVPASLLQYEFQSFCATAEKPKLGLYSTVAAGAANIILDALFIIVFHWGLAGAAIASTISQYIGGFVPLIYFARENTGLLRLTAFKMDFRALFKSCTNGISELLSNISMSIVGMLYNIQLLKYAGEDGVAAFGVLMYVNLVFAALFIGYTVGTAPVISYHYGAKNHDELKNVLKKSLVIITVISFIMFWLAEFLAKPLSLLFTGYDEKLLDMTVKSFYIYSFAFLFAGYATFGSAFFTALNNGLVSGIISFMRTFVFQVTSVLLMPLIFGVNGIWISIALAELLATAVVFIFLLCCRKKYHY